MGNRAALFDIMQGMNDFPKWDSKKNKILVMEATVTARLLGWGEKTL